MSRPNVNDDGIRVIDVEGLGWEHVLIEHRGEKVLLIDVALDVDERMDVMQRTMARHC